MNRDLYQVVTDKIVAALEAGTPPWIRPWSGALEAVPTNGASRRPYRGINCILLTLEAQLRGFGRNVWLTYRQAAELGAQVRGGERGTTVVFYKRHEVPAEAGDESSEPRVVPLLRSFTVFNVAQIDRLPERLQQPAAEPNDWLREHAPEKLIAASGARVEHGGFMAFYSPAEDRIQRIRRVGLQHDRHARSAVTTRAGRDDQRRHVVRTGSADDGAGCAEFLGSVI